MVKLTIEERLNKIIKGNNNRKTRNNTFTKKKSNRGNLKKRRIESNIKLDFDKNIDTSVEKNINKMEKINVDSEEVLEDKASVKINYEDNLIGGKRKDNNINMIFITLFLFGSFIYMQFDKIKDFYKKSFSFSTSDFSK